MVALSSTEIFIKELGKVESKNSPHTWICEDNGLVLGEYPRPHFLFDFAGEKLRKLNIDSESMKSIEKKEISLIGKTPRITRLIKIETQEVIYVVGSHKQMLIEGLNVLEELAPGTHKKLAMHPKKRSKKYVSENRKDLYSIERDNSFSEKLTSGYHVATNNKSEESIKILCQAVDEAGLEWGRDFKVVGI